jgi:hypothetical protein
MPLFTRNGRHRRKASIGLAAQQATPDAQSDARIANRQAVVDLIQQRREAAGC